MNETVFPDYLKPALERLEHARAAHLDNARRIDETTLAISRAAEQKAELEQENGSDASAWREAFCAAGAVITDELKKSHIARVARRELAKECENLTEILNLESDRLKGYCADTAKEYRKAHYALLSQYADKELDKALRESCAALVRAMKLKALVRDNPLANTAGIEGYVEPEKAVMQQVKSRLEEQVEACHIRLADEPLLYQTGLSADTLPHMDYGMAGSVARNKVWHAKLREREADLKARGLLQ